MSTQRNNVTTQFIHFGQNYVFFFPCTRTLPYKGQRRDYPNPPEEIDDPSTLKGCTKTQCLVGTAFFFVFLIATAVLAIVVNNKCVTEAR